jgi:hypothetical protein
MRLYPANKCVGADGCDAIATRKEKGDDDIKKSGQLLDRFLIVC